MLGEYFMGQMAGDSHAAMNAMMIQAHGEDGEEQIHIVMGKRLSGCDTSAAFPVGSGGWVPLVDIILGGGSSPFFFFAVYSKYLRFFVLREPYAQRLRSNQQKC